MSKSMNVANGRGYRRQLMATASALALLGTVCVAGEAIAGEDGDRATVWIELGGQFERLDGGQTVFAPSFFDTVAQNGFISPSVADKSPGYGGALDGSISFTPAGSDWIFSGAIRYGRSGNNRLLHQQPPALVSHFKFFKYNETKTAPVAYAQTDAHNSESHMIADFQVDKDVGLGMFGSKSASTLSAGIRFAHFSEHSHATIAARPDVHFVQQSLYGYQVPVPDYHQYIASFAQTASFRGVGPSLSWNGSAPLAGNTHTEQITFDWGVNAAVLFGKQKAKTHHHSSGNYHVYQGLKYQNVALPTGHGTSDRSRSVVVPNVGGFAGLSFRYDDAKISLGYRADFFFGAIDGGIATRKSENRGFYGPFASVSVGIGD